MSELIRTEIDIDPLLFSSANLIRTPGVHATSAIRDILLTAGILKTHSNSFTESDLEKYQLQGYFWEDIYCDVLTKRIGREDQYVRFGELAFSYPDGHAFFLQFDSKGKLLTPVPKRYILMTPDGMRIDQDTIHLAEFKWTTKSARMDPEKEKPEWFYQAKIYLAGLSFALEQWIQVVEWHVQFAVGSQWGTPPVYEEWRKEFSQQEIEDTCAMVFDHIEFKAKDPDHEWHSYWN